MLQVKISIVCKWIKLPSPKWSDFQSGHFDGKRGLTVVLLIIKPEPPGPHICSVLLQDSASRLVMVNVPSAFDKWKEIPVKCLIRVINYIFLLDAYNNMSSKLGSKRLVTVTLDLSAWLEQASQKTNTKGRIHPVGYVWNQTKFLQLGK